MLITVQGTTPKNSSSEVQHCTALMSTSCLLHPAVDHGAELRHLHQRFVGDAVGRDVLRGSRASFRLHVGIVVLHAVDAAEDFGKIERLDGDAARFEKLLAVADGVERRRPRADGADAQLAQAVARRGRRAANQCEILRRTRRIRRFGVQRGQRVRNAVLLEVVAGATSCRRSCRGGRRWSCGPACRAWPGPARGRRRSAMRSVSAMPRSSPKFGSVTMMPSMSSRLRLNRSAQRAASARRFDRAVLGLFRRRRRLLP